ncbi:hypothetical protein AYR62_06280 [Secundilactobacillus paracollinoides]|uniref:AAA family ATPase n=1 Tax=Secundilactobacillus paracollinoides TaxID=240427 RepID=UPI00081A8B2E|nr:SMC family ATPase [Secundilactobacillus paracollinoides]ANZ63738.1 hypothetical protein AYR62_06280 [Secundilactobacillus paracollinoides]
MRPLKLTLKNFGPYEAETIDFQKLAEVPVFLISGQTGSGKTTIFEALTFALYGESVTSDRPANSLRSDFAVDTEPTEVTLLFEHQGKQYEITRQPKQTLAKKRGSGDKTYNASAELKVFDNDKKVEDTTKLKDINIELEGLLQINRDQFSQIVLLPQGDFRRFLISDSEGKEGVLRKLFKTQLYQNWGDQIKDQLREANAKSRGWKSTITDNLKAIQWVETPDDLDNLGVEAQVDLLKTQQNKTEATGHAQRTALNKKQTAVQKQQTAIEQAVKHNQQLDELAKLEAQHTQLTTQEPAMAALKTQIADLVWAQSLKPDYDTRQQTTTSYQQTAQSIVAEEKTRTQTTADLKALKTTQTMLQAQAPEFAAKQQQIPLLEQQRPSFEKVAHLTAALKKASQDADQAQTALTAMTAQQKTLSDALTQQESLANQAAPLKLQQTTLLQQQDKLAGYTRQGQTLTGVNDQLSTLQAQITTKQATLPDLQAAVQTAEAAKADLENQRLANHIAELAQQLSPGTPCPICGSVDHPSPAVAVAGKTVTKAALTKADKLVTAQSQTLTKQQTEIEQLQQQLTTQQTAQNKAITSFETELGALEWLSVDAGSGLADCQTALQKAAQTVTSQLAAVQQDLDKSQKVAVQVTELTQQQADLTKAATDQQAQVATVQQQVQTVTVQLTDAQAQVPTAFKDLDSLDAHLNALKKETADFEQRRQETQKTVSSTENALAASTSKLDVMTARQNELTKQLTALNDQLTTALEAHFDGEPDWDQFKTLLNQLPSITDQRQQLQTYNQQVAAVRAQLETYRKMVSGERIDVTSAQTTLKTAQDELQQANDAMEATSKLYILNQHTLETIEKATKAIRKQANDLDALTLLSSTINGNGDAKLSLERYVLQQYLLEILDAANGHLQALSSGRYYLQLHEEAGTYAKNTGLELDVYDDNVGHTRSVHTLSGGESFIAALSLALALGEVIQNQAGGISIDALFIDEGFGSLDADSLQTAMAALEHIEGDHRMIGIISHVEALKSQIPYQIQVATQGQGKSHAKLVVPQ